MEPSFLLISVKNETYLRLPKNRSTEAFPLIGCFPTSPLLTMFQFRVTSSLIIIQHLFSITIWNPQSLRSALLDSYTDYPIHDYTRKHISRTNLTHKK